MRIITYEPRLICPDVDQLELSDYETALSLFLERFQGAFSGKFACYQFGAVRTPGISDLDLLIVVEDEQWSFARKTANIIVDSSELLHYIFIHEPLIVCQSLVPCLPMVHTLENCRFVKGFWDPLSGQDQPGEDARLIRHAVWNSFIRVAALELDNTEVGLRRSLILLHNLLTSAYRGNEFLQNPVSIPLTTEEIRSNVLSASESARGQLVKAYIDQVVKLLNTIDCHLDQELASKFDLNLTWFEVFPLTKRRFVAAPLVMSTPSQEQWKRFLNTVEVVPAPSYLVSISVALAQLLPGYLPPIKVSKKIMKSSFHQLGFTEFVKGITAISGIFKRNDVDYFFPKPFSIKPIRLTARDKVIQFVRFQITKQVLFPRRASD